MKNITVLIVTIFILSSIIPVQVKARELSNTAAVAANTTSESEVANVLLSRLFEIKDLDKSKLNLNEKRELRKEVRSIRDELKHLNGGIYLSVGAIIIILLILILLL